jgi:PAS domain-containing protein
MVTMRQRVPPLQEAFDVARRVKAAGEARQILERALDWLADGVALVSRDGKITYANKSFRAIIQRNDGIDLRKGLIELPPPRRGPGSRPLSAPSAACRRPARGRR